MNSPLYFNCIAVTQPLGTFYICPIPARQILPLVSIERRGITEHERNNVQRALDPKRQKEIARYIAQSDATFPTSVTLSADSEYIHIVEISPRSLILVIGVEIEGAPKNDTTQPLEIKEGILEVAEGSKVRRFETLPSNQKIALVIDGQHRIEGLRAAGAEDPENSNGDFELPLVFMFDLTPEVMARIFVTINSTQRKVDASLISDLFGLSSRRSPMRTCHIIASTLNNQENGPFTNGLKMLGKRVKPDPAVSNEAPSDFLSQGSFCKYILQLISRNSADDERRLLNGEPLLRDEKYPLRDFFIAQRDDVILRIIQNYFSAVQNTYPNAWDKDPANFLIRKTVGFLSLIKFLIKILPALLSAGKASQEAFTAVLNAVKDKFPESKWKAGEFSSSEADASKVANLLFDAISANLEQIIAAVEDQKRN